MLTQKDIHKNNSGKQQTELDHVSRYPVSRLAPPIELIDLAKEIETADQFINTRVTAKIQVIAEQINILQEKARSILEEARQDQELHRAHCSFKKKAGQTYHLYRKKDGSLYFSMLSPQDWNGQSPHIFEGSCRLEADMSWTLSE